MRKILIIVLSLSFSAWAQARWAKIDDAAVQVVRDIRKVTVNSQGVMSQLVERQVQILNERGRNTHGTWKIPYTRDVETVEILEAKTVMPDQREEILTDAMIEDKPISSEAYGFDEKAEVTLAYPQANPGSILCLKYRITVQKQPFPYYFGEEFIFGKDEYWNQGVVHLESEIPFQIWVNDPLRKLKIQQGQKEGGQTLSIELREPVYHALFNEPLANQLDVRLCTWVKVSAYARPEQLNKALARDYESVLSQALTPLLKKIVRIASPIEDEWAQINRVTSLLAETVRYMGDWRSNRGRFVPRALEDVYRTGFGDCKDFAANTVAVLRALGHQAWIGLVWRGEQYVVPEKYWPDSDSNHAIVRVKTKKGRDLWIDPTNLVSMAQGIFPDIQNRPAIPIKEGVDGGVLEQIAPIDINHAFVARTEIGSVVSPMKFVVNGHLDLRGEKALALAGTGLYLSTQALTDQVCESLGGPSEDRKIICYHDLKSREVQDISLLYSFSPLGRVLNTNLGMGIQLELWNWIADLWQAPADQVGIFWIATSLGTSMRSFLINGKKAKGNLEAVNRSIRSPWFDVDRQCVNTEDGILIQEKAVMKKRWISLKERLTPDYQDALQQMSSYLKSGLIILE